MQREKAVAVQYQEGEDIPRILATGAGEIAKQILRLAQEHQIPIHQDETLTQLLAHLPEGAQISGEAYDLVAEVVCFLYAIERSCSAEVATDKR